jgi:Putative beta-barrel porin 2
MKSTTTLFATGTAMAASLIQGSAQETPALFKVGNVEVRPSASYSAVYDDNIFLEHKHKGQNVNGRPGRDHDFIHTFSPGLRLQAGDVAQRQSAYMAFNYQAQFQRFSKNAGAGAIDQNGSLEAGVYLNKLKLGLTQSMSRASAADVQNLAANGRVRRANYDTTLNAEYEISEKTHANLILSQQIADYQAPLVDSAVRSATLFLDYQVLPKVKLGIGGDIGYMQVDGLPGVNHNPNSLYYSGLVRLDWQATEKVTIGGSTGVQHMNIQEQGASDPTSFVFALNASWKAAERTTLGLSADRRRRVSNALGAQQNEETSFAANLSHQLADALTLTLDGGYTHSHYIATTTGRAGFIRDDQYVYVKPGLAYRFMERAQASIFYQYRRNDANAALNANDFYANQLGLELSYRF